MKTTSETGPSWDRYRLLKEEHDREWEAKKPKESDFETYRAFRWAINKWAVESCLSAPTKPNSEYANNH